MCIMLLPLLIIPFLPNFGQDKALHLGELNQMALENNTRLKAYSLKAEQSEVLAKSTFSLPKTAVSFGSDQNNMAENGYPLRVWGVEQAMAFPTLYVAKNRAKKLEVSLAKTEFEMARNRLLKEVSTAYFEYQMLSQQVKVYRSLDSIYSDLLVKAETRLSHSDVSKLEFLNISSKRNGVVVHLRALESARDMSLMNIRMLTNVTSVFTLPDTCELMPQVVFSDDSIPIYDYLKLQSELTASQVDIQKQSNMPDLKFNYFLGSNTYHGAKHYQGFEVGVELPLFFGSYRNNVKSAQLAYDAQLMLSENKMTVVKFQLEKLSAEQLNLYYRIESSRHHDMPLADEIKRTALKAYELKEIGFLTFANSFESAIQIEYAYYQNVYDYNQVSLAITYFTY